MFCGSRPKRYERNRNETKPDLFRFEAVEKVCSPAGSPDPLKQVQQRWVRYFCSALFHSRFSDSELLSEQQQVTARL